MSAERAAEVNVALAWARAEGLSVVMLTQTFRHDRSMPCAASIDAIKRANSRLRRSRGWRGLAHEGNIMATEVTFGDAGWHPHLHTILFLRGDPDAAEKAVEGLRAEWSRALSYEGLTGNEHAWQVQPATAAGEYVAKFGAGEELTLGEKKEGRNGSRSPWQLLADARDGDGQAARLFQEYAVAFKGKRQLIWSRGLKEKALVDETREAEKAADEAEAPEPVTVRHWWSGTREWCEARRRRCALIAAVEAGTDLNEAEFGPSDAARWRDEVNAAQLIEGESDE
ncbi:MAG: hypothetical protein LC676_07230 [Loktanella sp.]|nr:hypothetical protein [Loktanella sp.]